MRYITPKTQTCLKDFHKAMAELAFNAWHTYSFAAIHGSNKEEARKLCPLAEKSFRYHTEKMNEAIFGR